MVLMMVPEDDFVEELDVEGGKKGGNKLLIIILLLNTILISVAIGYFIFFYEKKEAAAEAEKKEAAKKEEKVDEKGTDIGTGPIVELEPFVVNLDDVSVAKYLKVTVAIEIDKPEAEAELMEKKLVARDQILVFLSSLKVGDTVGIEGKASIKEGIINRLNNILVKGNVKNIYFKDFVVQ